MAGQTRTILPLDIERLFTQRQRRIIGNILHLIATQFFLLFIAILLLTWMEVWKGVELLHKVRNAWFTFGGAREMLGYGVVCLILGRIIDVFAKRFEPRLKNRPERGWHYRHR